MEQKIKTISPQALHRLWREDQQPALIDVRSAAEYRNEHVTGATHLALDELTPDALKSNERLKDAGHQKPLYITCEAGLRAQQAAQRLAHAGYHNLTLLEGGTRAWKMAGLPTERYRKPFTLQQQLQIAIGVLLLIKVVFGYAVHELFYIAISVIALGFIITGLTNWDGPYRLLNLFPWNQNRNRTEPETS